MTSRERLETVFAGAEPDRTPILGGWIACMEYICALTNVTIEEYRADPIKTSIRAYEVLGTDGLIDLFVPKNLQGYRCIDEQSYARAGSSMSLEDALAKIDALPSAEAMLNNFNFDLEYEGFKRGIMEGQVMCGEMVWMPAQWCAGARVSWYGSLGLGYEHFFTIIAAHPDQARKLMEVGGAQGYCWSRVIARAVTEGVYPHAVLLGEDICTQRGPMISPSFLEKYYAPQLQHGLQPLLDAGCKPVWHCDGDVRRLFDMLFDCGVQGLQGFQSECGLDIEYAASRRTPEGKRLLIFGPLSVSAELPVCTAQQVRDKVRHAIEVCRGNADLVLCTANTINPDVPLANIRAMYEAVLETG